MKVIKLEEILQKIVRGIKYKFYKINEMIVKSQKQRENN